MAKPKLDKKEYSFCPKCGVIVPKAKLTGTSDFFEGDSTEKNLCPFCGNKVEELE